MPNILSSSADVIGRKSKKLTLRTPIGKPAEGMYRELTFPSGTMMTRDSMAGAGLSEVIADTVTMPGTDGRRIRDTGTIAPSNELSDAIADLWDTIVSDIAVRVLDEEAE